MSRTGSTPRRRQVLPRFIGAEFVDLGAERQDQKMHISSAPDPRATAPGEPEHLVSSKAGMASAACITFSKPSGTTGGSGRSFDHTRESGSRITRREVGNNPTASMVTPMLRGRKRSEEVQSSRAAHDHPPPSQPGCTTGAEASPGWPPATVGRRRSMRFRVSEMISGRCATKAPALQHSRART